LSLEPARLFANLRKVIAVDHLMLIDEDGNRFDLADVKKLDEAGRRYQFAFL